MDVNLKSRYIGGISYSSHSIRRYEYKIDCPNSIFHNKTFYQETCTNRISEFEWGKSESIFYWNIDDKLTYKTLDLIFKSKNLNHDKSHKKETKY